MTPIERFTHLGRSPVRAPDQTIRNAQVRGAVVRLAAVQERTLRVRSTYGADRQGARVDHYVFEHDGRGELRAVMLTPAGPPPWPGVLVCPGRNATLERVTGLIPPDHPGRDVAAHLTRAGFLTLTLDHGLDLWAAPAALGGRDAGDVLDGTLRLHGGSLLAALAEDALAALDWLRARPDVAATGLFGHSMGAAVALHTALLADEPIPLCAASHLGTYQTMIGKLLAWNQYTALPSILRHADLPELYTALSPAPLQIQYGNADARLDHDDAAQAGERIATSYEPGRAEVLDLPMGHSTGLAEAADFFTRTLAKPAAGDDEPFVPAARVSFGVRARLDVLDLVDDALASGSLTLGPCGARLEDLAGHELGRGTAAVSSGSSALEIALRIVGVEGRTVLVPANTFFATAASAVRAGALVDFVDMEPDGLGLDPEGLRAALDAHEDVAAVVPVHLAGVLPDSLPRGAGRLRRAGRRGRRGRRARARLVAGRAAGGHVRPAGRVLPLPHQGHHQRRGRPADRRRPRRPGAGAAPAGPRQAVLRGEPARGPRQQLADERAARGRGAHPSGPAGGGAGRAAAAGRLVRREPGPGARPHPSRNFA